MSDDFRESEEKRIEMKTFSDKAVQLFVKFLYGYELEEEKSGNVELMKELVSVGEVHNVPSLQSAAASLFVESFTAENKMEMMDFVKSHFVTLKNI